MKIRVLHQWHGIIDVVEVNMVLLTITSEVFSIVLEEGWMKGCETCAVERLSRKVNSVDW